MNFLGIAECTNECTERAAATSSTVATSVLPVVVNSSRRRHEATPSPMPLRRKCQHNLLNKIQDTIHLALESVLSSPPSAHQTSTVFALKDANTALIKCRDVLMWIYGKKIFLVFHFFLLDNELIKPFKYFFLKPLHN